MTLTSDPAATTSSPSATSAMDRVFQGRALIAVLLLLGIALRCRAYFGGTSLWLDEMLLARNILELSLSALLTEPLQLDQVAPRGFLLVEKISVLAFGANELALRLFPFVCSIGGLLLFWRLASRVLDRAGATIALALCAVGVPFIKFGAEVKQYGVDAAAAILLTLVAVEIRHRPTSRTRLVAAGTLGVVVVWFSQASVVVMAGIGLAISVDWVLSRNAQARRMLLITIPLWAVASVLGLLAGLHSMTPATREFMHDFWAAGFVPSPVTSLVQLRWYWDRFVSIFADPTVLRYQWPAVFALAALVGFAALWRRNRSHALIVGTPLMVALVVATLHQYPFRGRLTMYLVPSLLLALGAAAGSIRSTTARLHPALGWGSLAAFLVVPVLTIMRSPPPYEIEHWRTVLQYLATQRQPGDAIYVFPLSRVGMQFYGPQFGLQLDDWITVPCDREDTRAYLHGVDRFRGTSRLWILSSGARPFRTARSGMREYLETIGRRTDALVRPSLTMGGVTLELYDLSDEVRLGAANVESFPALPMPRDPRPGCRPWSEPHPGTDAGLHR
jgi:hypothetical protein